MLIAPTSARAVLVNSPKAARPPTMGVPTPASAIIAAAGVGR
jgi:hypothetical protein